MEVSVEHRWRAGTRGELMRLSASHAMLGAGTYEE